jgi:hypothetical protein
VMIMANRNVHVFENEIDGNGSAAVLLMSYTRPYEDPNYNPLPRDVVVRDNEIGRNGWSPGFPGGDVLLKAIGGQALPPVIWDGVTNFTPKGMSEPQVVRVRALDGPVLSLGLPAPGALMQAKPSVTPTLDHGAIEEPKPVALPTVQAALAS